MEPTGRHLILDFWGCDAAALNDAPALEAALVRAAEAADGHILRRVVHAFAPQGVTGLLLLEESHLSIHTWPERGYAALDLFMCGAADPYKSIPVLRAAFEPATVQVSEQKRGVLA